MTLASALTAAVILTAMIYGVVRDIRNNNRQK